ncbi:hypothetical protein PFTANZ_01913 [Plasmodium falciparum Tanzania (2000708)]|uniref:Uncharacterized protein n=2 Tax=Plasmodium falciparum TaxID=5833 RepID=A0A024W9M4_PLAFA|nr:hypothetical protein PFTANZ_01913 [Plasmodium falciparum Tanzania (2000708)]ETW62329.1 hypothetical protein PFMC_01800 [Plasmodium falciparum CAMP/Malaysia]
MNIKTDLQYTCVMFFPRFLLFYYDSMRMVSFALKKKKRWKKMYYKVLMLNFFFLFFHNDNVNKIFLYINIKRDYLNMNT